MKNLSKQYITICESAIPNIEKFLHNQVINIGEDIHYIKEIHIKLKIKSKTMMVYDVISIKTEICENSKNIIFKLKEEESFRFHISKMANSRIPLSYQQFIDFPLLITSMMNETHLCCYKDEEYTNLSSRANDVMNVFNKVKKSK